MKLYTWSQDGITSTDDIREMFTYAFVKASKSKKREVVVQSISEGWVDRVIANPGYTTL